MAAAPGWDQLSRDIAGRDVVCGGVMGFEHPKCSYRIHNHLAIERDCDPLRNRFQYWRTRVFLIVIDGQGV